MSGNKRNEKGNGGKEFGDELIKDQENRSDCVTFFAVGDIHELIFLDSPSDGKLNIGQGIFPVLSEIISEMRRIYPENGAHWLLRDAGCRTVLPWEKQASFRK